MPPTLTAAIHARIDPSTKEAAERVLDSIGLSPAEALRLFYRQIAFRGEFPLELRMPNRITAEVLRQAERGENVERFSDWNSLHGSWGI